MAGLVVGSIESLYKKGEKTLISEMKEAYFDQFQTEVGISEERSWRNSLYPLIVFLKEEGFANLYLIAEYNLIGSFRLDAVLLGHTNNESMLAVIVELKQWSSIKQSYKNKKEEVCIHIDGEDSYRLHPVTQTLNYVKQLEDHHSEVNTGIIDDKNAIKIKAIQYLHNFKDDKNVFFINEYQDYYKYKSSFFTYNDKGLLKQYLLDNFDLSLDSSRVAEKFNQGAYVIGTQGLKILEAISRGERTIEMRDEQIECSNVISEVIDSYIKEPRNICVLVKGDAGTGKTYLGMESILLAIEKNSQIHPYNCAFTMARNRTLKSVLDNEANFKFPYLHNLGLNEHKNRYKLIVVDEAHRINEVKKDIDTLFKKDSIPKIAVILQDDKQRVRLSDSGTYDSLYATVKDLSTEVKELELTTQQRSGSVGYYTKRILELLYNKDYTNTDIDSEFRIETDYSLKNIDYSLKKYIQNGFSAKWYAPFNWEWKTRNKYIADYDIYINDNGEEFKKLWNPDDIKKQYEWFKGYPNLIKFEKRHVSESVNAIDQVGCVYTAQGLEYDYVGFIWGKDLYWDEESKEWKYDLSIKQDYMLNQDLKNLIPSDATKEQIHQTILQIMLNRYYILLTRARKGVYIWFEHEATKRKFESVVLNK